MKIQILRQIQNILDVVIINCVGFLTAKIAVVTKIFIQSYSQLRSTCLPIFKQNKKINFQSQSKKIILCANKEITKDLLMHRIIRLYSLLMDFVLKFYLFICLILKNKLNKQITIFYQSLAYLFVIEYQLADE
ncbi:hypothetical protein ABPG72_017906 [Tetrahymena utriculariae]